MGAISDPGKGGSRWGGCTFVFLVASSLAKAPANDGRDYVPFLDKFLESGADNKNMEVSASVSEREVIYVCNSSVVSDRSVRGGS